MIVDVPGPDDDPIRFFPRTLPQKNEPVRRRRRFQRFRVADGRVVDDRSQRQSARLDPPTGPRMGRALRRGLRGVPSPDAGLARSIPTLSRRRCFRWTTTPWRNESFRRWCCRAWARCFSAGNDFSGTSCAASIATGPRRAARSARIMVLQIDLYELPFQKPFWHDYEERAAFCLRRTPDARSGLDRHGVGHAKNQGSLRTTPQMNPDPDDPRSLRFQRPRDGPSSPLSLGEGGLCATRSGDG